MKKKNSILSFRNLFLILALVPVLALAAIVINLVQGSWLAVSTLRLGLFSGSFRPGVDSLLTVDQMHYGMLPALWGTLEVVLLSMLIALPVSLTLAVLANDFAVAPLGSIIRWLNGVLSGIPPIIYALMGTTFFLWFFWAKFAGKGLPPETLPPPNLIPSDASCVALGGVMLALLIVPFMTPLLDDAIHSVPSPLKEASLALGANRWYTLRNVTLPASLPGIVNAILLGSLTALGESIIVAYTVGLSSPALPSPIFDVLQRTAPLTSTIASLAAGGFSRGVALGPVGHSVAYVMGLLLLLIAFAMLGVTFYLQGRIKKGLGQ